MPSTQVVHQLGPQIGVDWGFQVHRCIRCLEEIRLPASHRPPCAACYVRLVESGLPFYSTDPHNAPPLCEVQDNYTRQDLTDTRCYAETPRGGQVGEANDPPPTEAPTILRKLGDALQPRDWVDAIVDRAEGRPFDVPEGQDVPEVGSARRKARAVLMMLELRHGGIFGSYKLNPAQKIELTDEAELVIRRLSDRMAGWVPDHEVSQSQ